MSFLRDLVGPSKRSHDLWREGWTSVGGSGLQGSLEGESRRTAAGETVTQEKALGLAAYFAALRNIAQDVAKLPRQLRKHRTGRGSDLQREHPAHRLIANQPNPIMGGQAFVQLMQFRVLGWGNAYAEIVRDRTGVARELWPVQSSRVQPVLLEDGRTLVYEVRGKPGDEPVGLLSRDMFHLKGIGNGIEGLSLLRVGAEVLGLGLAAQRNAARFFSENMAKRVVVFSKASLSAPGRKALRQRILEDQQQDPEGRRKLPVIEGDYTLGDMGIPPEDAQLLESREFTTEEIARLVRITLEKIQHHKQAKGWSSLELLETAHANDTLLPWCKTWEEECWAKLLAESEQAYHFFKWVLQGLMRGDTAARVVYFNAGLQNGWLSPNDVRELEDFNPIEKPEADEYRVQGQMRTLEQSSQPPAAAAPPPRLPPPAPDEDLEEEERRDEALDRTAARMVFGGVFLDAARRIVRKEAHALERALRTHASNAAAFGDWAAGFYGRLAGEAADAFEPAAVAVSIYHPAGAPVGRDQIEAAARAWWGGGRAVADWCAYCRGVATGKEDKRVAALQQLMLDLVLPEPAHA